MPDNYPPKIEPNDKVILFDGECKLCNGWSKFIIRYDTDKRFQLCSMQSEAGLEILKWFGLPTDSFETMLVVHGNRAYTQSDAFIYVMGQLRFPWHLVRIIKLIPRPVRNWLYDRVARNRYKIFGKLDSCMLPTAEHKNRFL